MAVVISKAAVRLMVRAIGRSSGSLSSFAKTILVVQSVVIVGLSIWMYREYASNQYLQAYLSGLFQGRGSIIEILGIGGFLGTVLVGVLLKAGSILGEIEHLSEKVEDQVAVAETGSETSVTMPVLRMVDPEPVDEIGRLHSSMRRWNEKRRKVTRTATP